MYRTATDELLKWKNSQYRKPMVIKGARQVGKTWLMQSFGQTYYQKVAYVNFENNVRMRNLFKDDYDIHRIITGLQIESGVSIDRETLLILDEIQEVPQALTSLKYFYESKPDYHILAAGSVLGIALHTGISFPVGKVDFLNLYPLSFIEFLNACGNPSLLQLLEAKDFPMITNFKSKYIDLLKNYFYVGGMPEAVLSFIQTSDYTKVREVQKSLLLAYEQDFSKHAPYEITPRIRLVWNSFPAQLARENRKFIYGLVRQGARAREFELAVQWLMDSGLIHQVFRVSKPGIPLKAYQDHHAFKLFMVDVGLLGALSDLDAHTLLQGNQIFQEFKGALTEQYVLQQLIANKLGEPFYWSAEKATAEIDFLIQSRGNVVPIEVKSAENLRAKSLQIFCQQFKSDRSVRSSMSDFRDEGWLVNLPLYAISLLEEMI